MSELWKDDSTDDGAHTAHFVPDAWKASWDFTQILPVPSQATKRAAEKLVRSERVQQGVGWLLLAHLTVTLGFMRVMSRNVCWITWAIFMLEVGVKLARRWGLTCCFQDVPCAYVPLHQGAAKQFIDLFGQGLGAITVTEVGLGVAYLYFITYEWIRWSDSKPPYDEPNNPYSTKLMLEMITGAGFLLLLCCASNLFVLRRYDIAMKLGKSSSKQGKPRSGELDRSLCLTWWVHIARHRHLSAAEARSQPGVCGLPGQWYESVVQLKRILEQSTVVGAGNDVKLVWLSQEMAMRALLSVAIQGHSESCHLMIQDDGFRLLLLVLSEGKPESCRGLAAAAIAELADHECIESQGVKLAAAVFPLKRLARSHVVELKEMALGALLNLTLNNEQRNQVVAEILSPGDDEYLSSDGGTVLDMVVASDSQNTFVDMLLHCVRRGPTTTCQVLASSLLVRLAPNQRVRDTILRDYPLGTRHGSNLELFVKILRMGLTDDVQASVAGLLWELAYWDAKAIGDDIQGDSCIQALVSALWGDTQVAAAAAGALASLAFNSTERKRRIVATEGSLDGLTRLLRDQSGTKMRHSENQDTLAKVEAQGQAQAARALRILAASNDENQNLIVHAGAIAEVVKLLQKGNSHLHMQAAATLDAISHRNRRIQDFIGTNYPEVFPRLTQLLDPVRYDVLDVLVEKHEHHHILEMVLEKVALALRSIAEGHRGNRERFLEAGAKERLQSILIRHRERDTRGNKLCNIVEKALSTLQ
ncbi:unnamed protein product [Calypogeia fissa]